MVLVKRPTKRIYSPLVDSGLFKDWNWNFDFPVFKSGTPMVNIRETDTSIELDIAAPGMSKEDFSVELENGVLTVSSSKKEENAVEETNYIRKEFGYTKFERSFELPDSVHQDRINAKYLDGVLKVSLEKLPEARTEPKRSISIE